MLIAPETPGWNPKTNLAQGTQGTFSTVRHPRVTILGEAISLTDGERDKEYGDPLVNLTAAREFKDLFRKHAKRPISPAEMEALDMVLTKFARLITGTPKRDSYVDLAGYAALAGEMAERDQGSSSP